MYSSIGKVNFLIPQSCNANSKLKELDGDVAYFASIRTSIDRNMDQSSIQFTCDLPIDQFPQSNVVFRDRNNGL